MITVIEFKPEHLDIMPPRKVEASSYGFCSDVLRALAGMGQLSYAWTAMNGAGVVAMGGVQELWPGVAEAWVLGSRRIYENKFSFHRAVKRGLGEAVESGKFRRIQCLVRAEFRESMPWVESLGFGYEGTLLNYAPDGEDCHMYAMVAMEVR